MRRSGRATLKGFPQGDIRMTRLIQNFALALLLAAPAAQAQLLPLDVSISGDTAEVRIGPAVSPLADLQLDFDDASGLSAASLGLDAQLVTVSAPTLLARLPSGLVSVPTELPLMITVEPPALGGLAFERRVHVEVHTHALPYTAGSRLRLFKAPLGGAFRDITNAVEPGSVRTRGTTGGFSQFIVALDLRPTDAVVAQKVQFLRDQAGLLAASEEAPLVAMIDGIEDAVAVEDFAAANALVDAMRSRVSARAGTHIPDEWRATRDVANIAGELLSGLDTLAFSIGYLRDYGP